MTKLNPKLPAGDLNGLADRAAEYVREPHKRRVLLIVADTAKVVQDTTTGDAEPLLRILAVEELTAEDAPTGETLMRRGRDRRSGKAVLDFPVEDEITKLFKELGASLRPGEKFHVEGPEDQQ